MTIEEYLEKSHNGFKTRQDEIDCHLAETGADREMDFNPELEYEHYYQAYLVKQLSNSRQWLINLMGEVSHEELEEIARMDQKELNLRINQLNS